MVGIRMAVVLLMGLLWAVPVEAAGLTEQPTAQVTKEKVCLMWQQPKPEEKKPEVTKPAEKKEGAAQIPMEHLIQELGLQKKAAAGYPLTAEEVDYLATLAAARRGVQVKF